MMVEAFARELTRALGVSVFITTAWNASEKGTMSAQYALYLI
jgi:hypothetical protein